MSPCGLGALIAGPAPPAEGKRRCPVRHVGSRGWVPGLIAAGVQVYTSTTPSSSLSKPIGSTTTRSAVDRAAASPICKNRRFGHNTLSAHSRVYCTYMSPGRCLGLAGAGLGSSAWWWAPPPPKTNRHLCRRHRWCPTIPRLPRAAKSGN